MLRSQCVREQGLGTALPSLRGKVLACDCPLSRPREAEAAEEPRGWRHLRAADRQRVDEEVLVL